MIRLLLLVALLLVPAAGARSQALVFTTAAKAIHNVVEQESPNFFFPPCSGNPLNEGCDPSLWVTNPTNRVWDVDDWWDDWATPATIESGASVSDTVGIIADGFDNYSGDDKQIQARVTGFTTNLTVTLTSSLGETWTMNPVRIARPGSDYYEWSVCTSEHVLGPYPEVPDSNGGTGIPVDYTLTITNTGRQKAQKVGALLEAFGFFSGGVGAVCPV